jgi:hypothetical protein
VKQRTREAQLLLLPLLLLLPIVHALALNSSMLATSMLPSDEYTSVGSLNSTVYLVYSRLCLESYLSEPATLQHLL